MAKEQDVLLEHEYDGIQEYDNPMPSWWTMLGVGSIIFTLIYIPWMHFGLGGLTQQEELEREFVVAEARRADSPRNIVAPLSPEAASATTAGGDGPATLAGDPAAIEAGRGIFATNCVPCHGPEAKGLVGPNLTDAEWIHGGTYANIQHTIIEGVPAKGMISWKTVLQPQQIAEVAAFVHSLGGGLSPTLGFQPRRG